MYNSLNPQDYMGRLNGTIVVYDGFPVYITVAGHAFNIKPIQMEFPSKAPTKTITFDDPKLDISTPPLGYFNAFEMGSLTAIYVERLPVRKWRQGLDADDGRTCNVNCNFLKRNKFSPVSARSLYSSGYEDLVLDKYPTLEEALKKLSKSTGVSIALSREIALSKVDQIISVFYKHREVGYMELGSRIVKVPKEENSYIITKFLRNIAWEVQ